MRTLILAFARNISHLKFSIIETSYSRSTSSLHDFMRYLIHSIVCYKGHREICKRDFWAVAEKICDSRYPFMIENLCKACRNRQFFIDLCISCKRQDWVAVDAVYCEPYSPYILSISSLLNSQFTGKIFKLTFLMLPFPQQSILFPGT